MTWIDVSLLNNAASGPSYEESARHRLQARELLRIAGPPGHHRTVAALRAFQEDPHLLLNFTRRLASDRDGEDELRTAFDDDGLVAELESSQFVRSTGEGHPREIHDRGEHARHDVGIDVRAIRATRVGQEEAACLDDK